MTGFTRTGRDILIPRAHRLVVFAETKRHPHALRQLSAYLPEACLEVVDAGSARGIREVVAEKKPHWLVFLLDRSSAGIADFPDSRELDSLPEDAILLRSGSWGGLPALIIAGGGCTGTIYAVNELGHRHLKIDKESIRISDLNIRQIPALPYRLLWTWDHSTNWYLEQTGIQEIGALNYYSKPKDGFLQDCHRLVDFMSLNRIGGVTIYGFLRDNHGGIEAAKELCRYATERGVRILAGVGINAYGGIYWEGNHKYNLSHWLKRHPELRARIDKPIAFHIPELPDLWFPESQYSDTACPSKPQNARYHEEAIAWLSETFAIGGINFETGDYGVCGCPDCARRRAGDETWSLRDQALLYPRLFEAAKKHRKDLWLVSEAYWDNILNLDALAPLSELPDEAIYQFCFNRSYWPKLKRDLNADLVKKQPRSKNILRTHMGSQWNHERYELVASRFAEMMQLAVETGLQGATIFGEVSSFSVVNEINYLAFSRFGYNQELTWDSFVTHDLGSLLGGEEAARRYLALVVCREGEVTLLRAVAEARDISRQMSGDSQVRWDWLVTRLNRKRFTLQTGCR